MRRFRKKAYPYILILPAIVLVSMVSFFPMTQAIRASMYKMDFLELDEFIGLSHYKDILVSAEGLREIFNSFVLTFGTLVLAMSFAFILAVILNRPFRFKIVRTIFRSVLILPYAISWLIAGLLWMWLLSPHHGPVGYLLRSLFNWTMPAPLTTPSLAMPTLIQTTAWRLFPLAMLFILASLQTVPLNLLEAAKIDGATGWQSFRFITFPLIKNTVLVTMVLLTLFTFNMVTLIITLTGGGPGHATTTLAFRTFQESFQFWHLGYASALAVIIFIFNIGFSLLYIRILKTERYY